MRSFFAITAILIHQPVIGTDINSPKADADHAQDEIQFDDFFSQAQQIIPNIEDLSLSETLEPNPYAPWTHEAYCLTGVASSESSAGKTGEPVEYCAYTNADFRCGRGISVVTTPSIAKQIASSDPFANPDDCQLMPKDAPYEEVHIPGRGRGAIANRTIEQSELVMIDSPTVLFNTDAFGDLKNEPRRRLIWRAMQQLPADTRDLTLEMAKSAGGDEMEDIIQTNAFTQYFGNLSHDTVLREAALLNHDCRPNVLYRFDHKTYTHHGHALRRIAAGEELLHTYIDVELPSKGRQHELRRIWGFDCACSICKQGSKALHESDARLARIQNMKAKMIREESTTPSEAKALLDLYDEEGLIAPKYPIWSAAAYAHSEIGDKEGAAMYAKLVHEYAEWLIGPDDQQTMFWGQFAEHPDLHPSWMAKVRSPA